MGTSFHGGLRSYKSPPLLTLLQCLQGTFTLGRQSLMRLSPMASLARLFPGETYNLLAYRTTLPKKGTSATSAPEPDLYPCKHPNQMVFSFLNMYRQCHVPVQCLRYEISHQRTAPGTGGRSQHTAPPFGGFAALSTNWSWRAAAGYSARPHPPAAAPTTQEEKKKSVQFPQSLCPDSQRTLPAQMYARPVQTVGLQSLDSTAKAQEPRARIFSQRARAKSPREVFQVPVLPPRFVDRDAAWVIRRVSTPLASTYCCPVGPAGPWDEEGDGPLAHEGPSLSIHPSR